MWKCFLYKGFSYSRLQLHGACAWKLWCFSYLMWTWCDKLEITIVLTFLLDQRSFEPTQLYFTRRLTTYQILERRINPASTWRVMYMFNFYLKAKGVILKETGVRGKSQLGGNLDLDFFLSSRSLFHLEARQVFPAVDPGKK